MGTRQWVCAAATGLMLATLVFSNAANSTLAGSRAAGAAPVDASVAEVGGGAVGEVAQLRFGQPHQAVGGYRWPLDGEVHVTRRFDPPARRWLSGHRGVDLAAAPGAVVRAAGDGVVHFAGPVGPRSSVSVYHAGGLRTTYEPLSPVVAAGDRVRAGDPLGVLEPVHPGCAAAACLHWGLRRGEFYVDPLMLLAQGRARLLPTP